MEVRHVYALYLICLVCGPEPMLGDTIAEVNASGIHCGTVAYNIITNETAHYHCVECLYPQNCLSDNECRPGTAGSTCEKCVKDSEMKGYHRLGSMCIRCPSFSWSAVSFGVYFLILLAAVLYHGLSGSLVTKLKLLCHFLQYVLLTFHIKIAWSESLTELFDVVNFGSFNSNILLPECLFSTWPAMTAHYLEWLTSLSIPVVVFLLGKFLDSSMRKISSIQLTKQPNKDNLGRSHSQSKRTMVRRLVVMVIVIMYMPSILSCIRTFLCSDTIPKFLVLDRTQDIFLLDNSVKCTTYVFQTIHFVGAVFLFVIGVGFPLLLVFFTLRQKKWDLLYSQWALYSPVYESYKDRYCFWEAIPMLRKFICMVVTESYPISPFLQSVVQLGTSVAYLLAVIVLRPYRECHWANKGLNIHMFFEVVSNIVVCLIQVISLSTILNFYDAVYDIVGEVCIGTVLVLWLVIFVAMACENTPEIGLTDIDQNEEPADSTSNNQSEGSGKKGLKFWKKNKIEQDPEFIERVNKNKTTVDF